MTEEVKAVEEPVKTPQEEPKKEGITPSDPAQVAEETVTFSKAEAESLIKSAEEAAEIARKKSADAENYKRGMLKYKRLLDENGIEEEVEPTPVVSKEEIAELVKQGVAEALKTTQKDPEVDKLDEANTKIEEMRRVLANSVNTVPSSAGTNLDKAEVVSTDATKHFSPDQIAEIKAKFPHLSVEEIMKNVPKGQNSGFTQS